MRIETYTVRCDACRGRGYEGYTICPKCEGNGQVVIVDERHTLRAAVGEFLADVRSKYLGAVRAK
jgi:DnaJ-class molecular chaperone